MGEGLELTFHPYANGEPLKEKVNLWPCHPEHT